MKKWRGDESILTMFLKIRLVKQWETRLGKAKLKLQLKQDNLYCSLVPRAFPLLLLRGKALGMRLVVHHCQ